ncbi:MAG: hypothetical protein ACRCXZ_04500 [Patescibacteria group bacterium]
MLLSSHSEITKGVIMPLVGNLKVYKNEASITTKENPEILPFCYLGEGVYNSYYGIHSPNKPIEAFQKSRMTLCPGTDPTLTQYSLYHRENRIKQDDYILVESVERWPDGDLLILALDNSPNSRFVFPQGYELLFKESLPKIANSDLFYIRTFMAINSGFYLTPTSDSNSFKIVRLRNSGEETVITNFNPFFPSYHETVVVSSSLAKDKSYEDLINLFNPETKDYFVDLEKRSSTESFLKKNRFI